MVTGKTKVISVTKYFSYLSHAVYRTPDMVPGRRDQLVKCDWGAPPPSGKVCHINTESFAPCVVTNYFGYRRRAPCVFLQIITVSSAHLLVFERLSEIRM